LGSWSWRQCSVPGCCTHRIETLGSIKVENFLAWQITTAFSWRTLFHFIKMHTEQRFYFPHPYFHDLSLSLLYGNFLVKGMNVETDTPFSFPYFCYLTAVTSCSWSEVLNGFWIIHVCWLFMLSVLSVRSHNGHCTTYT